MVFAELCHNSYHNEIKLRAEWSEMSLSAKLWSPVVRPLQCTAAQSGIINKVIRIFPAQSEHCEAGRSGSIPVRIINF